MLDAQTPDPLPAAETDESSAPPGTYPALDAFVSASGLDAAGVRASLESWIGQAPDGDREKERQAQLHYWLFRAGDAGELDNLKALAAANPELKEVGLYLRLAVQDLDETWT